MATLTTKDELLDVFKNMTVLELNEFLKAFEEEFGVTAAAPVAVAAGAGAAGGGAPAAEEEQDEFDVHPHRRGDKKIQVIKELRTLTSLGLKEAKDLVDACPQGVPRRSRRRTPRRRRPSSRRPARPSSSSSAPGPGRREPLTDPGRRSRCRAPTSVRPFGGSGHAVWLPCRFLRATLAVSGGLTCRLRVAQVSRVCPLELLLNFLPPSPVRRGTPAVPVSSTARHPPGGVALPPRSPPGAFLLRQPD